MVYLQGINAHLVILDTALPEYPPTPSEQRHTEPNTVLTYVEVVPNTKFSIFLEIPSHTPPRIGDAFFFRIFVDGVLNSEVFHRDLGPGRSIAGYLNGKGSEHPLSFPHVAVDLNESEEVADAESWDDKEVVLQISQARLGKASADDAGFGEADESIEPAGGSDSVFAFTFKYRPRLILRSILNISKLERSGPAPWDESASMFADPDAHPADAEWKKSLWRNDSPELYCYCRKIKDQKVVSCDNDDCKIHSFHWGCVGVTQEPEFLWFCPDCKDLKEVTVGGQTGFLGPWGDPDCRCGV